MRFTKNPSERVQLAAVKEYPDAINYIDDPTPRAVELAKRLHAKYYG